ncbi:MAG TPA: FAD-dependent oxidoreductase [Chthonomonadales bacterium]|nr:FAD-dependent oxidoreductase [Chthonomonadales bacterium]
MPDLTIDGRTLSAPAGTTVLVAARSLGIEIPTLCHLPGHPAQASCLVCLVKVEGRLRLAPSCAMPVEEGMVVRTCGEDVLAARRTAIELLLSDHLGDCIGPCQSVCPAQMDIPTMVRHISAGRMREALVTVKETIPLPATLGRICPELCEKGCRRAAHDGAVAVCKLKRFVADEDLASGDPYLPERAPATGKRVAIVGSGPAGLSAAYYLLQLGHACVLLDERDEPGGALRHGVPEHVLPRSVLDAEIDLICRLGAELRQGVRVGVHVSLDELRAEYDAVLLATGNVATAAPPPGVPLDGKGVRAHRETMQTDLAGVFVAGSALAPTRHAVRSVADGRAAAHAIGRHISGERPERPSREFSVRVGRLDADGVRPYLPMGSPAPRKDPADGDAAGYARGEAVEQASRCLHCECAVTADCHLRRLAMEYEAQPGRYRGEKRAYSLDTSNPEVIFEPGKCIACGLCVRIAAEASEELGLTFVGRGFAVRTAVPFQGTMAEGLRRAALACADACPTGSIVRRAEPDP